MDTMGDASVFHPRICDDKSRRPLLLNLQRIVATVAIFLVIAFSFQAIWESSRRPGNKDASFLRSWIPSEEHSSVSSTTTPQASSPGVLNVHIVPHTHDDVGWLKTVDQYYYGLNNSIQDASVHDIIDSVVASLQENPKRTFTYVEQKFFSMWWEQQNDATKDSVRLLVANKQLNFANGGWCMHDEASTHYMGMIDQTTLGHTFLKNELGVIPRVGWQLDPFGHSSTQASLMTSKMGFDALYFGRIDYQDLRLRQLQQECEGLWNATDNLHDATVFWSLTGSYGGNYGSPQGFCFDLHCSDPSLVTMNSTTLVKSMKDVLRKIRIQSDQTKGNHIMLTMGSDFQYMRARQNFANLDTLIETITDLQQWQHIDISALFGPRFDKINIFYSSPEIYTKSKYDERQASNLESAKTDGKALASPKYTVKRDDFFPYSDCEHCYWTGYFASRIAFKRLERVASSFLLATRQIESMLDFTGQPDPSRCEEPFHNLEDASGVAQHHDGVSGTAKQHVANDYSKRLQAGINEVSSCAIRKMKRLLLGENASEYLTDLSYCQLLNETICDVSQGVAEADSGDLYVIVYNSLAHERSSVVHLPVSMDGSYNVTKIGDGTIKTVTSRPSSLRASRQSAIHVLSFSAGPLPGSGASVFKVAFVGNSTTAARGCNKGKTEQDDKVPPETRDGKDVEVSNGLFSAIFDGTTGALKKVKTKEHEMELSQSWGYYTSYDLKYDRVDPKDKTSASYQNSGAYIFRPSTPEQQLRELKAVSASFVNTSVGMEVHVLYSEPWVKTVTRILEGQAHLEIEYAVGPVPIDDNRGKEIVTRFDSSVESSSTFFTDSNGREFMKRTRNYRPTWKLNMYEPVAGNYYPVNAAIYIEDSEGSSLAVATDRTQGGSSLVDGSIELMVHRRTLADDSRGVGEPLNETDGGITPCAPFGNATRIGKGIVVRGTHRVLIGNEGGATLARSMMDSMFAEPIVLVGSSNSSIEVPFIASNFSGLTEPLPFNVMLLTRRVLYSEPDTTFLIRVGHQYGVGEDKKQSEDVELDLSHVLPGYEIEDIVEMTLSGNQEYKSWVKNRLDWVSHVDVQDTTNLWGNNTIKLSPMDIRTFQIKVKAFGGREAGGMDSFTK